MFRNCPKESQRRGLCAQHSGGRVKRRKQKASTSSSSDSRSGSSSSSSSSSNILVSAQPAGKEEKHDEREETERDEDNEEIRAANILIEMANARARRPRMSSMSLSPQPVPSQASRRVTRLQSSRILQYPLACSKLTLPMSYQTVAPVPYVFSGLGHGFCNSYFSGPAMGAVQLL